MLCIYILCALESEPMTLYMYVHCTHTLIAHDQRHVHVRSINCITQVIKDEDFPQLCVYMHALKFSPVGMQKV